jgi:hypothetical protein
VSFIREATGEMAGLLLNRLPPTLAQLYPGMLNRLNSHMLCPDLTASRGFLRDGEAWLAKALPPRKSKSNPRGRNATMAAWQFGRKIRWQLGKLPQSAMTPVRQKKYDAN